MSLSSTRNETSASQVITGMCHLCHSAVSSKNTYLLAMSCLNLKNMPSLRTASMNFVPVETVSPILLDFILT